MKGHKPDTSGARFGSPKKYPNTMETMKKPKCAMTPSRERRQDYTPSVAPKKGRNYGG